MKKRIPVLLAGLPAWLLCAPAFASPPAPQDVFFVVDESLSLGQENYDLVKAAVADAVAQLRLTGDGGQTRVGVIRYSGIPFFGIHVEHALTDAQDAATVDSAIRNMDYAGGRTATGAALQTALDRLSVDGRAGARQVVVVITDGNTNDSIDPCSLKPRIDSNGVEIRPFAIGDDIALAELECLVDDPADVQALAGFEDIAAPLLAAAICTPLPTPSPSPSPTPAPSVTPTPASVPLGGPASRLVLGGALLVIGVAMARRRRRAAPRAQSR